MGKVDIAKIDKKFDLTENVFGNEELTRYRIPDRNFSLHGVFLDENEGFVRMPVSVAKTVSPGVEHLNHDTSGGRLCFSTDSKRLELSVTYDYIWPMQHMTLLASSGFILIKDTPYGRRFVKIFPPSFKDETGFTSLINLDGDGMANYILYFPLYGRVKSLSIGLDKIANVATFKAYRNISPIIYYGSSITQGGCASRPDNSYPAFIERKNRIDFINLGFSGNGKGEKTMREYISSINCSLFVCDFNHSGIPIKDLLENHIEVYRAFRSKNPLTPILILSKTHILDDKKTDNSEREKIILDTYLSAVSSGDKNVYFLSGHDMFDKSVNQFVTVDTDHPTDLGFYLMAEKIYAKMCEISPLFK